MTLYHCSPENLTEIRNEGVFGGIFAADREAAESHGGTLHSITLSDSEIIEDLCDIAEDLIARVIADETRAAGDEIEALAEVVIADGNADEALWGLLYCDADFAETSWEIQRLRGRIAAAAGYKAVECEDEHGTVYLVLPGAAIEAL